MAETLTKQQLQAVTDRGGRLLVSAAAGSGKTKVLVDRLLSYLLDPIAPANIDDFLIITYTKAAASELRGKIAAKLAEHIARVPENKHMQQQLQRLHLTKISTVHAFCADVLRDYAYMLDISSDFRVADEDECLELQNRALQIVLEEAYADGKDENFYAFVDSQGFGRDDRRVPEIILKVYNAAKCHLDPDKWLDWCISIQDPDQVEDVSQTVWGKYLIGSLHAYLDLQITVMSKCAEMAAETAEMSKPAALLAATVEQLRLLRNCERWDDISNHREIDYGRLTFSKKCTDTELIDQIKAVREDCKAGLSKKLNVFTDNSRQVMLDYKDTLSSMLGLISLVRKFEKVFDRLKRGRRVLDFTDLEHKTLDLLLGKRRSGITKAAEEIAQRFREVMVDEYQDSNAVQDAIFRTLTERRQNCFMVGAVKQSIYQFRLADPSIFIEKYNTYLPAEDAVDGQGRKVVLSNNFRSSGAVIKAVNDVFTTCMSPAVGGLVYGAEEALYEGLPHIPLNEPEIELFGIDIQEDTYREEASFVAGKIKELLDGKHMVRHGESLRPIVPDDIVILLRSPGSVGMEYQMALESRGIRCASGAGVDLLQTEEIETLCSLLRVINNPLTDIPLVAVLMSRVFCFSADELAQIRCKKKYGSIYDAIKSSETEKAISFVSLLTDLRKAAQMLSVSQLLMYVFSVTRIDSIYSAMPDGDIRSSNLQQFCQIATAFESTNSGNLSRFLEYLDALAVRGFTAVSGDGTGGSVTIMSIHKSKGLEFPVVFLCGLARDFNMENARAQVLCDKELGLGLSCVDTRRRIQYPSIAKKAIAAKIKADSVSEEMRVLYVAMTRARDRLIMTYSVKGVEEEINALTLKMALSDPLLLTSTAKCPGLWVLMTANVMQNNGWKVQIVTAENEANVEYVEPDEMFVVNDKQVERLKKSLDFRYPYLSATATPSKQTATQLKGRVKDHEAAEHTEKTRIMRRTLRKPGFAAETTSGTDRGTAMHAVMQYIRFENCIGRDGVSGEIRRLVAEGYISQQQAESVNAEEISGFFETELGRSVQMCSNVLREFKFSILINPDEMDSCDSEDRILLQGVVDCAMIEEDGITVIDFKSDRISDDEIEKTVARYSEQVKIYAAALTRIYNLPVKTALLYFFHVGAFAKVI